MSLADGTLKYENNGFSIFVKVIFLTSPDHSRETALTAKEFALLKTLWEARGNIVTIDALCAALWEGPLVGYENTLMVHIRRLREKVEAEPSHPRWLLTVRGLGYRLKREERP